MADNMNISALPNAAAEIQRCSRCGAGKLIEEFTRLWEKKIRVSKTCNACSESRATSYNSTNSRSVRSDSVQDELIVIQQDDQFEVTDHDELLYHVGELEDIIKTKFGADQENLPEHVGFAVDIELKEAIKDGSRYYWEIKNVYYGEKNNVHNGVVTAFLICTQRNDRIQQTSDVTVIRRSEARKAISREGVLPTFVLIDKDSGEIAAVEEA
ncbi:10716_t:CDS:2, partial [Paraglomus occultum]